MELIIVHQHMLMQREKNILFLGKDQTAGLDRLDKVTAEPKYFIIFTETKKKYLPKTILQLKQRFFLFLITEKDFLSVQSKRYPLCLANVL